MENDIDARLKRLEEWARNSENYNTPGFKWFSSREKCVILSGIILILLCFIVLAYLGIFRPDLSVDDKLVIIITTILGYLFGYLPVKDNELSAMKKVKESQTTIKESQDKLKAIKVYEENEKALRRENEELKSILREIAERESK